MNTVSSGEAVASDTTMSLVLSERQSASATWVSTMTSRRNGTVSESTTGKTTRQFRPTELTDGVEATSSWASLVPYLSSHAHPIRTSHVDGNRPHPAIVETARRLISHRAVSTKVIL